MAAPQNHWKLGLFVVAGLALTLAVVVVIGARSMQEEVALYESYFDESVQGLDVGSPIKFRGVTVGYVGKIDVAPDHRHVMVESELGVEALTRLGLDVVPGKVRFGAARKLVMSADLRLQLASSGLTGVKFLQLDFFDVALFPPPELPFPVPENTIPTAPSLMKNLEDTITSVMNSLPQITAQTSSILAEVDVIVREVREQRLPDRLAATIDTVDDLLAVAQQKLELVDTEGISQGAKRSLAGVSTALRSVDLILARVAREGGLLTGVERATGAVGDALRDTSGLGGQLVDTLVSVQATARSLRRFTDALEQDPDMLLKGRSPETE